MTEVTVTKVWVDDDNAKGCAGERRPGPALPGRTPYGSPETLNAGNNWTHLYQNLPVGDGTPFVYTAVELTALPDYITTYSRTFTITQPDVRQITVTKVWADDEDAAGLRPESIQVQLYQDTAALWRSGDPQRRQQLGPHFHRSADQGDGDVAPYVYTAVETHRPAGLHHLLQPGYLHDHQHPGQEQDPGHQARRPR